MIEKGDIKKFLTLQQSLSFNIAFADLTSLERSKPFSNCEPNRDRTELIHCPVRLFGYSTRIHLDPFREVKK